MTTVKEMVDSQGIPENEFEPKIESSSTPPPAEPAGSGGVLGYIQKLDFSWLMSPTGEGAIEDYVEHPLNFSHSKGIAQILRGLTGILGNLKLAVIDIGLGAFQFVKEKKENVNTTTEVPGTP